VGPRTMRTILGKEKYLLLEIDNRFSVIQALA
jgi:hypothetical protein